MSNIPDNKSVTKNFGKVVKPKNLKGTLRRLWSFTKGTRKGLFLVILLSVLSSASAILSPYITGKIVTMISNKDAITFVLILLALLYISDWLVKFIQQLLMAKVGQKIIYTIRKSLFNKMTNLPLKFFDKIKHGELMSRLTNDIDNISNTISNSLILLFTYAFTIIGILVIMLYLNIYLTLVTFIAVICIFILTKIITKHTKKLFHHQQVSLGELNANVEESISGLYVIKAFNHEKEIAQAFEEKNNNLCDVSIKALVWSGYLMPIMNVINNICYLAIAVLSGILYIEGNITTIGLITSFLLYVRQFTRPFIEIANIYNNFQTAVAGAERVFEIMDEEKEPIDKNNAYNLVKPKGDIEFKNVSFGYNSNKKVLNNINIKIPAGTKVAIVGATGSGKSTLINLLTRFYDVTEGSIYLDGVDLRDYKLKDLRKVYGVVLQDTNLFVDSVKNNICYGSKKSIKKIKDVADSVGASAFIERLPKQYDTVLTQGGMELSQGERQLITIARAIITNAPIMILDEATSSVDTVTEQKIRNAIKKACAGRTSFIIAHRLSTIKDADMIIVLENGRILEQGNHLELLKLNGYYAKLYNTQTSVYN